jgi:hypothetical protein
LKKKEIIGNRKAFGSANVPDNVPVIVHIWHQYISKKKAACQEAEAGEKSKDH